MKVDIRNMADGQVKHQAKQLKKSACLVCGERSKTYRKLHLGEKVALIPLCRQCKKTASVMDLNAAMQFSDMTGGKIK